MANIVKSQSPEYKAIHSWLRHKYGDASKCESPKCIGLSTTYEWALRKNKRYERKKKNFLMLCKSCHTLYDMTDDIRKRIRDTTRIVMLKIWKKKK